MLSGIKVLDLTNLLPGPFCTLILAEMGAEVIKVEAPNQGDLTRYVPPYIGQEEIGSLFVSLNRGKRSITLNLKTPEGQEILKKLVAKVDVLVEGFRPKTAKNLGLNYDEFKKINPSLIMASITGFGQNSPYKDRPAHDLNYLGYAGLLAHDPKNIPLLQIADVGGGSFWAAIGILGALFRRERDPERKGEYLDISITDGIINWLNTMNGFATWLNEGFEEEEEHMLDGSNLWYRNYETKDGKYITFACIEPHFWKKFCELIDKPGWIELQFVEGEEKEVFENELEKIFKTKKRDKWVELLADTTCIGPILSIKELSQRIIERTDDFSLMRKNEKINFNIISLDKKFDFSLFSLKIILRNTTNLLLELGYEKEEILRLKNINVI